MRIDTTGKNPLYFIEKEIVPLDKIDNNMVYLSKGYFYEDGLIVEGLTVDNKLRLAGMVEGISATNEQPVYSILTFEKKVTTNLVISYQAYTFEEIDDPAHFADKVSDLRSVNQNIYYSNIKDSPEELPSTDVNRELNTLTETGEFTTTLSELITVILENITELPDEVRQKFVEEFIDLDKYLYVDELEAINKLKEKVQILVGDKDYSGIKFLPELFNGVLEPSTNPTDLSMRISRGTLTLPTGVVLRNKNPSLVFENKDGYTIIKSTEDVIYSALDLNVEDKLDFTGHKLSSNSGDNVPEQLDFLYNKLTNINKIILPKNKSIEALDEVIKKELFNIVDNENNNTLNRINDVTNGFNALLDKTSSLPLNQTVYLPTTDWLFPKTNLMLSNVTGLELFISDKSLVGINETGNVVLDPIPRGWVVDTIIKDCSKENFIENPVLNKIEKISGVLKNNENLYDDTNGLLNKLLNKTLAKSVYPVFVKTIQDNYDNTKLNTIYKTGELTVVKNLDATGSVIYPNGSVEELDTNTWLIEDNGSACFIEAISTGLNLTISGLTTFYPLEGELTILDVDGTDILIKVGAVLFTTSVRKNRLTPLHFVLELDYETKVLLTQGKVMTTNSNNLIITSLDDTHDTITVPLEVKNVLELTKRVDVYTNIDNINYILLN